MKWRVITENENWVVKIDKIFVNISSIKPSDIYEIVS